MPKDTFYHLDEGKKKRILDAAEKELIRVPISELSINKIIQSAEISRGSFYQYFEDKHDLVMYLLSDYIEAIKNEIVNSLTLNQGDVFLAMGYILCKIEQIEKSEGQKLFDHIMVDATTDHTCSPEKVITLEEELLAIIMDKIDRTKLIVETDEEIRSLIRLIFSMLKGAAVRSCYEEKTDDQIVEELKRQLEFIRLGVEREKS